MDVYGRLGKDTDSEGPEVLGKKSHCNVTFLRKIPHILTSERTRDFMVTERGVIACGMANISTQTIEKQIYLWHLCSTKAWQL